MTNIFKHLDASPGLLVFWEITEYDRLPSEVIIYTTYFFPRSHANLKKIFLFRSTFKVIQTRHISLVSMTSQFGLI